VLDQHVSFHLDELAEADPRQYDNQPVPGHRLSDGRHAARLDRQLNSQRIRPSEAMNAARREPIYVPNSTSTVLRSTQSTQSEGGFRSTTRISGVYKFVNLFTPAAPQPAEPSITPGRNQ
jgi:hypothetical protein